MAGGEDKEKTAHEESGKAPPNASPTSSRPTSAGTPLGTQGSGLVPTLSLPKGGGAIRGIGEKFSTNPATGTGSLSAPIATSPGRAGFELGLELSYDSGSGNGPFGLGWHLSTPSITRKTDKGLPRYADAEDSDVFVLSGAEDLVPVLKPDGTRYEDAATAPAYTIHRYRPRTEGLFARIERWTNRKTGDAHWRAITRDNVLNIYGRDPRARIADPERPGHVFSWLLEETRDDRGNIARYGYKAEDGAGVTPARTSESNRFELRADGTRIFRTTAQRYLKRIQYGNRAPVPDREAAAPANDADWLFEVVFDYGEHDPLVPSPRDDEDPTKPKWQLRPDPFSNYRATFEVRTYRLCQRVLMFHRFAELPGGAKPCLVRSTDFTYDSCRVRSQDGSYDEGPIATYLIAVTQAGYKRDGATGAYERATLPPLDLGYARPILHEELRTIDRESLEGIPGGVDGATAQWVDLDGEGIPGVLLPTQRAWFYKPNLGGGRLAPPVLERSIPAPAELRGGAQLTDLGGDGNLDLVSYAPPLAGYFERTVDRDWAPFVALPSLPNINWSDPNLRFLDLNGDGFPDVLITEHEAFVWYQSRAKEGFEPATRVSKPGSELDGPAFVFADATETIQLADMSGDGLVDIVRVRNGEVSYWPNLGYGRFGRKVTLDQSPWFDSPDQFDARRVRFADIDGSGTSDIVYLGRDGVRLYFNLSGNGLSAPRRVESLAPIDSLSGLSVVDLLGQGTACLVWSSLLPANTPRPLAYVDLMGGKKPHVLESVKNNLGGETRIAYAASTKFYLQDKEAGRPWLTRLAFPVHVIERVERYDHVAKSKLVTRFAYHHGFFDGYEREFRGFACVEQWDAESFSGEKGKGLFPELPYDVDPADKDLNLPPVRTVTWFHTGAWLDRERLEAALAKEYYDKDPQAPLLADTTLPSGLSVREEREAARALRGQILRQEIYAEDGTPEAVHPYTVSERNYVAQLVQHAQENAHAVFFVHPHHTINLHCERKPNDPRMQQETVLAVDDFGNVTRSVAVGYPRRVPAEPEQGRLWATVTDARFTNRPNESGWYRIGVPIETTSSELTGLPAPAQTVFSADELRTAIAGAVEIAYEATAAGPGVERRVIERERRYYYRDYVNPNDYWNDPQGPLALGNITSRALPHQTLRLALTPGLVTNVYGASVTDAVLQNDGRYVKEDGLWWAPSGRVVPDPARFYLPAGAVDPFGKQYLLQYDKYSLLVVQTEDPVGNRVTAGLRHATGVITQEGNDYRLLAPTLLSDPNRNRTAVEADALGLVIRTAAMGRDGAGEGDTLQDPTTRIEYDLHRWNASTGTKPAFVHTFAREKHGPANPRWQETYSYIDGSGREAMKKVQAEPGPVPIIDAEGHLVRNADGSLKTKDVESRWVGTGRTVFNNKGHPVKKYEPYFSETPEYEDEKALVEWGVTPILRYDPLGRLVRTDQPSGTHARVVFDAWRQETWDENDTVLESRWYIDRGSPDPTGPEPQGDPPRRAAWLSARHANTPPVAHLDALGRTFLSVAQNRRNGTDEFYPTRVELDVEGNQRSITDARGIVTITQDFDVLGRKLRVVSKDAGESRTLFDVGDKPIHSWDARGYEVRREYDALQRPRYLFAQRPGDADKLVEVTVYGEKHAQAEARKLQGRAYQSYDGAGVLTNSRFDLNGNLIETTRRLAKGYKDWVDWSVLYGVEAIATIEAKADPQLETEPPFETIAEYDALSRVALRTMPDKSVTRPTYNEANFLEQAEARIRGAQQWTMFVKDIDYNARGQRELFEYGGDSTNPNAPPLAVTKYTYDPNSFRLICQRTTRLSDGRVIQDLAYEHDGVGNIVQITDAVSFGNPAVSANGIYEYDALYQLVKAVGREHPGQQPTDEDAPLLRVDHPNDMQALQRYRETYSYDPVGNIREMKHQPLTLGTTAWTRTYEYALNSNQLMRTSAPGDVPGTLSDAYLHDLNGNMRRMPHLADLQWDYADRLRYADRQGGGKVYFAYDAAGQRVRKIYEHSGLVEERIYLGGYEVYRKKKNAQLLLERQTLHVMDDKRRVALVETKTADATVPAFALSTRLRFQLENHVGSSTMELDDAGAVISYEEYFPFGGTSFHAAISAVDVSLKRYRYTGKERDEETGLYYHGARYYAAWLGRWSSCDPVGGMPAYRYARNSPICWFDPDGADDAPWYERALGWTLEHTLVPAVELVFGGSVANAPESPTAPTYPRQTYTEQAALITVTVASGGVFRPVAGAVMGRTGSVLLSRAAGGFAAGSTAGVGSTAVHDVARGEASSPGTYLENAAVAGLVGAGVSVVARPGVPTRPSPLDVKGLIENPRAIWGRSAQEIADAFTKAGYAARIRASTRGSRQSTIVEVTGHESITQIQVHPGGGRHGGGYYKISTSTKGTLKVVDPQTYKPTPGEKATIIKRPAPQPKPTPQSGLPASASGSVATQGRTDERERRNPPP